ncbi:MAG: hypothetical protein JNG83_01280 [Opitutaceae bacterium]|nr:hypothetical protein [Opitutaceae bacterium]
MKARFVAVLAALLTFVAPPAGAQTAEQWIAKARAYLGPENALKAVTSIHFIGALEADANTRLPAEIMFQKPYQQRIIVTAPKVIEVTALDGYDAWQKRVNPANPTQWQVTILDASQVKRLRANTWENLNFFAGLEKKGGRVTVAGEVTVDGIACVKLSFHHDDTIVFQRYFDKATGRLVKTETESGAEIREEGEMLVNGIRFPRKVINKSPSGQTNVIAFDKVLLNERIPASEFAVPELQAN